MKTFSKGKHTYNVLNKFELTINIKSNPYEINLNDLIYVASRNNPKRAFLFVSKILGKHVPINPHLSLLGGLLLGYRYIEVVFGKQSKEIHNIINSIKSQTGYEYAYKECIKNEIKLENNNIFIGFAETATGLAHAMSDLFLNGEFIITTRDNIIHMNSVINFEEEHSHATAHKCYSLNRELLNNEYPIVLIDDEISSGKTTLNIIEAIQNKYPRREYTIVSILDWRSPSERQAYTDKEKELNIKINEVSIISGEIHLKEIDNNNQMKISEYNNSSSDVKCVENYIYLNDTFDNTIKASSVNELNETNNSPYLIESGRFGFDLNNKKRLDYLCNKSAEKIMNHKKGKNTLCLGSGEFIYIPMKIASLMGDGIQYHSTTKSPIFPCNSIDYGVRNAFPFKSIEDDSIMNYIYNIPNDYYDEVFLFVERDTPKNKFEELIQIFKSCNICYINIVLFTRKEG